MLTHDPTPPLSHADYLRCGRPSLRTPELVDEFCYRISRGRSVSAVCRDSDMPEAPTIYRWRRDYPDFAERFAEAKEDRKEATRDRLVALADKVISDDSLDYQRAAIAGGLLFKAEQLSAPKQRVEVTGKDGGALKLAVNDVTHLELARRVAFMLTRASLAIAHKGEGQELGEEQE